MNKTIALTIRNGKCTGKAVVNVAYETKDFGEMLASSDPTTKYLVLFNPKTKTIYVDNRADAKYKTFAALHEEICCGGLHSDLISLRGVDATQRCREVEKFVASACGDYRKEYLKKRKAMFEYIINEKLNNDPALTVTLNWINEALAST